MPAPLPQNEAERLAAVRALGVLDTAPEPVFDALVRAASLVCGVPVALFSLIDAERQWFKANLGLPGIAETPRALAFCAHTILQTDVLEVPDAAADPRFADNELVKGQTGVRFYAGAPVLLADGAAVGSLCVIDRKPGHMDETQREVLRCLAQSGAAALEAGRFRRLSGAVSDAGMAAAAAQHEGESARGRERQRLASIIATSGVGTWEWHVPSGIMRFDERLAELLGFAPDEVPAAAIEAVQAMIHPEDLVQHLEAVAAHFAGASEFYAGDLRLRHRGGHWIFVHCRGSIVSRTEAGVPEVVLGTILDITQRNHQEAALRTGSEYLHQIGLLAQVGAWGLDVATGALTWTEEMYRLHGLRPETLLNLGMAIAFYAPAARPLIRAAIERAMTEGAGWDLEVQLLPVGRESIWVRTVGTAIFKDGKPCRVNGALQDITALVEKRQALEAANQRIELATEGSGIGIWDLDLVTGHSVWAPQMFRLYGVSPDSGPPTGELLRSRLHPDDRAKAAQALDDAIERHLPYDHEVRVVDEDGGVRYLRVAGRVSRDDTGRAVRLVGTCWDVTEIRNLAVSLSVQHELLRVTLRSIGDGVITTDQRGIVEWLNPVAERLTGWTAGEAAGRRLEEVFHVLNEDTREVVPNPVHACLAAGKITGLVENTLLISRDGAEYGIEDSAAPIRNDQGEHLGVVLVFHDVSEQRRLAGEMSHRATHDTLTGLVNRPEFENRLRWVLHMAQSDKSVNAVLYIDLDQFKIINDTSGHAAGDQALRQVAKLLGDVVRASDTLARLGGDEFAIILQHCGIKQAMKLAQRICDNMESFRFMHEDSRFRIGASIGLVPVDDRWESTEAIMQAADSSCYAAKEAGRNRVHCWFDSDTAMQARRGEMQWTRRLEQALEEDRFVLFAQRIHALGKEHAGIHAEILLRLREPDGLLIAPGAFLPAAERYHLAPRIDRWVLQKALAWMRTLPAAEPPALDTICVNLSGQSVGDAAFHAWAHDRLVEAGPVTCARLCLEITETVAITNLVDAARFVRQVRELGVRVALDDFGAGASSFGYLKNLTVDFLKIDGQFIRDLSTDPLDEAAVRSFADVAKVAGLRTVAECVDHPDVLSRLRDMGIDFAQGFLMHRPSPIDEIQRAVGETVPG